MRCRTPCNTRSRLAGSAFAGQVSNLLARGARFQLIGILPARACPGAIQTPSTNTRVSIYSTSGNPPAPDSSLHVLNNPSSLVASTTNTFTADAGDTLAANTTYAVVVEITHETDATSLVWTSSDAENSGAADGWSIGNKRHQKQGSGSWTQSTGSGKLIIAIRGTPKTSLPVVSLSGGGAVSEGGSAAFTMSANPAPSSPLTVNLAISQTGSFVATGGTGSKTVAVPTSGSATYSVATVNDNTDEPNGSVTAAMAAGTGYTLHATASNRAASVTVRDNDGPPGEQDPQNPQDQSGETEQPPRDAVPLQLALWTDKPGYRAGDTVRLYRSLEPHDDDGRYRTLVYLERPGGEERRWLAPLSADGELHAEAVDAIGVALDASRPRLLSATDRELAFEGEAPGPGLWQFVLELRPGSADEQTREPDLRLHTRRAWANFAVAERSQLLNRSGFDRELTRDATLRSHVIYCLGHQLFVRDGATLTIEPATLVKAWGRNAAIIVEAGARIVAEGTREAPVVLTCSSPVGRRGRDRRVRSRQWDRRRPRPGPPEPRRRLRLPRRRGRLRPLRRQRVGVRLRTGSGLTARDLLVTRFFSRAIEARGRSGLLFAEGESSITGALLYRNGYPQLLGGVRDAVEFVSEDPKLRDARLRQPRPAPEAVLGDRAGRGGMLHRGLRHEEELARGMDRVRAGVGVRAAGAG